MGPCWNLDIARSCASRICPGLYRYLGWYGCFYSCLQYLGMCDIACTKVIARSSRWHSWPAEDPSGGHRKGHGGVALVFRPAVQQLRTTSTSRTVFLID